VCVCACVCLCVCVICACSSPVVPYAANCRYCRFSRAAAAMHRYLNVRFRQARAKYHEQVECYTPRAMQTLVNHIATRCMTKRRRSRDASVLKALLGVQSVTQQHTRILSSAHRSLSLSLSLSRDANGSHEPGFSWDGMGMGRGPKSYT